jgi:transposase
VGYANTAQESFLDGSVAAFDRLGGVPARVRLDNLKPAVLRVLLGRERLENPRFVALRSHYGFDAFYCQPGIDGAHEKGGVEVWRLYGPALYGTIHRSRWMTTSWCSSLRDRRTCPAGLPSAMRLSARSPRFRP